MLQGGDQVLVGTARDALPFGELNAALGVGPATIWDERNSLIVNVVDQAADFLSRNRRDVLDGGGLICVGDELVQYRDAGVVAPGQIRLMGLLRGRFGTIASSWPSGTAVMAVSIGNGVSLDIDSDMVGRQLIFLVVGAGDPIGGSPAPYTVVGSGRAPLAPVHLKAVRRADGAIFCSWVERSRSNWQWDALEASSPEQRYVWHFRAENGPTFRLEAASDGIEFDLAAQQTVFGGPLPAGEFRVEALGDGPQILRVSGWNAI